MRLTEWSKSNFTTRLASLARRALTQASQGDVDNCLQASTGREVSNGKHTWPRDGCKRALRKDKAW